MHYSNLVIVERDADGSIDDAVESAMGEKADWWDFYQIGGRWTGLFDGYDPAEDLANIEVCTLCAGTGKRPDMECVNGCNGCSGKGKHAVWPTSYKRHDGDVIPVEALTDEHYGKFYRVVSTKYGTFGGEEYLPWKESLDEKFRKRELPPLSWVKENHTNHLAVVVDNHN